MLDSKVNELTRVGVVDDFMLVSHMAPDMPLFKRLMDLADRDGMSVSVLHTLDCIASRSWLGSVILGLRHQAHLQ